MNYNKLAYLLLTCYIAFAALALTPAERTVVQQAQIELRAGKADYAQAQSDLAAADKRAADAETHAKQTDTANTALANDIKTYAAKAEAIAQQNVKMKLVYDECTKWMDLGAFVFGFKQLAKHLMWFAIGGVLLVVVLYGLSFAFPVIGLGLSIVVKLFAFVFRSVTTAFAVLEAHLKPKT